MASNTSIFSAPQCLIETNLAGNFSICERVVNEVAALDKPFVVVSIAGKYRTGKSYLMNRLHGENSGFSLGKTIEACTKGIWIWVRDHPKKENCYLVLLDTEGLSDPKKGDEAHDNNILILAILLSSVFCYNAKGAIDDDSLQKLNFITEMSRYIHIGEMLDGSEEDLDCIFPHFIYILRDFTLELKLNGEKLNGPDDCLESCLQVKPPNSHNAEQYNHPRICLRKYFRSRHCFAFEFPVSTSSQLEELDNLPDSSLNEDFIEQSKKFCKFIHNKAPFKCLDRGNAIRNGSMWVDMLREYVTSIQKKQVPCISNAVEAVADRQNKRATEAACQLYNSLMFASIRIPVQNIEELEVQHELCQQQALEHFTDLSFYDSNQQYLTQLCDLLSRHYEEIKTNDEVESRRKCFMTLCDLEKDFTEKLNSGAYHCERGFDEYQRDVGIIMSIYEQFPNLGSRKHVVWQEYFQDKCKEVEPILEADQAMTAENRELERELIKRQGEMKLQQIIQTAEEESIRHANMQRRIADDAMQRARQRHQQEMQRRQQHDQQVLRDRLRNQERLLREGFLKDTADVRATLDDLRKRCG